MGTVLDLTSITPQELEKAVTNIQERAENLTSYSQLFVDPNIVNILTKRKNQVIYGRRGTGKTHLFNRIKEYYRDAFDKEMHLPIYIDASTFTERSFGENLESGIAVLIAYRRFLDAIINSIEEFIDDNITLTIFDRVWPRTSTKEKIQRIKEHLKDLRKLVQFGEVEIGYGTAISEHADKSIRTKKSQQTIDFMFKNSIQEILEGKAELRAGLSKVSSSRADESLKVIYEGLTILNIPKIGQHLDLIIDELELSGIIILLDEWSKVHQELQPLLAEMIKSTLVSGRKIFIKFACLPFLTNLSATKPNGESIGFPIGEELFVDVDLDRYYNAYIDQHNVTIFLLRVLQKHLGYTIEALEKAEADDAIGYFTTVLFENKGAILELTLASAGIPRDFLRVFVRAFHKGKCTMPITIANVRMATHEFFQEEKFDPLQPESDAQKLYDNIFKKVCLPSQSYVFFVSQDKGRDRVLRELLHRRLIHLLFQGYYAVSYGEQGIFDIYAIDYGKYIMMASTTIGETAVEVTIGICAKLAPLIGYESKLANWRKQNEARLRAQIIESFIPKIKMKEPDLKSIMSNCSKLVIDSIVSNN